MKITNPKFKYLQNIKGNTRNILYRICSLYRNEDELNEFIRYFPEYSTDLNAVKIIYNKISQCLVDIANNINNYVILEPFYREYTEYIATSNNLSINFETALEFTKRFIDNKQLLTTYHKLVR